MKISEVHASFEKRVSDGNFGGECARVDLLAQLEEGDDLIVCAEMLQLHARTRVHMDLRSSLNPMVRRQVQLPDDMVKIREAQLQADPEDLPL